MLALKFCRTSHVADRAVRERQRDLSEQRRRATISYSIAMMVLFVMVMVPLLVSATAADRNCCSTKVLFEMVAVPESKTL